MNLNKQSLIERMAHLALCCSDFSIQLSKPATTKEMSWRQKQVLRTIPESILRVATDIGSRVHISWTLESRFYERSDFLEEFPNTGYFAFNFYETTLDSLEGWEHSFSHWQEYGNKAPPFGYEDLFPVFSLDNGDLIVEIIGQQEQGAIYYLDHDGGSGDWMRLAASYDQFIDVIAALWFPDLNWYGSLDIFYDHEQRQLSLEVPISKSWCEFISSLQVK